MAEQTPIIVTDNSLEGQFRTLLRYTVAAVGAFALGKGWIDDETLQFVTVLVTVIGPAAWGMWDTYRSKSVAIASADAAPDSVAQLVHK